MAVLHGHRLCFHKISQRDGSAKCDALATGQSQDRVWGVVYRIDPGERAMLDEAEGLGMGYRRDWVDVEMTSGQSCQAFLYLATLTDERLLPFSWYKHHVLAGARENALPSSYIELIACVSAQEDADRIRHQREMSIHDEMPPRDEERSRPD